MKVLRDFNCPMILTMGGTLLFLTSSKSWAVIDAISEPLNNFSTYSIVNRDVNSLRSYQIQMNSTLGDSPLTINLNAKREMSGHLPDANLIALGGIKSTRHDSTSTTLTLLPRNVGSFNSTQFEISHSFNGNQYQSFTGITGPNSPVSVWNFQFSYDVLHGGSQDTEHVQALIRRAQLGTAFYQSVQSVVVSYVTYRALLLDVYSSWCKLKTSEDDLAVISRAADGIKVASEVKLISRKQYLSILDTKNYILRSKIAYELDFESNKRKIIAWNPDQADGIVQQITAKAKCAIDNVTIQQYMGVDAPVRDATEFEKSIPYHLVENDAEVRNNTLTSFRLAEKPSLRPLVGVSQTNQSGYNDRSYFIGLNFGWSIPGRRADGLVDSALFDRVGNRNFMKASRARFISDDAALSLSVKKRRELLEVTWASLLNSNELVRLLEIQKNIGQADSVTLSTAYTQRNQILSSLFDNIVSIEKDYYQWKVLTGWPEVLASAGFKFRL